jgi:hypothetical protein
MGSEAVFYIFIRRQIGGFSKVAIKKSRYGKQLFEYK